MSISNKLFSAISQITTSNIIVRLLSIATMPVLTRQLSEEAYGISALSSTIVTLFSTLAITGMGMTYARSYHNTRSPNGKTIEVFVWKYIVINSLIASLLCIMVWHFIISEIYDLRKFLGLIIATSIFLTVLKNIAQVKARLNNQYTRLSLSILLSGLIAASSSMSIAFFWRTDELALMLSVLLGLIFSLSILKFPSIAILFKKTPISAADRFNLIKIGLPALITAPAYWVMSSVDFWLLGYFEDSSSVGIYSIGCSIGLLGVMVNNAIQSVWLPEVSRLYESGLKNIHKNISKLIEPLILLLCIVWLAVTAAGGDLIRLLAAQSFHDAADIIPYIATGVFFYGILHLANAILLLKKKLHYAIPWWFSAALLSLLINFFLIPHLGRIGASYTQAISFAFVSLGIAYTAQQLFPLQLRWIRILSTVLVVLFSGILMHSPWSSSPMHSILLKLPIGILISVIVISITNANVFKKLSDKNPFK